MKARLDQIPVYEKGQFQVSANLHNLARIALKRLGNPLRFELPRLRTLDFVLEDDAWIVVDRALNDIPIIAWLNFSTHHRSNLHEPITCERRSYHAHATMITDKTIEAMQLILGEQLGRLAPDDLPPVTQIKRPS